jgi:hypothetical protein
MGSYGAGPQWNAAGAWASNCTADALLPPDEKLNIMWFGLVGENGNLSGTE